MATFGTAAPVIRRMRQRLGLSQEALARLLSATKGAVQHSERGRNSPDLARLLALRQLCPRGREQVELDGLIGQAQLRVTTLAVTAPLRVTHASRNDSRHVGAPSPWPQGDLSVLRRENERLGKEVRRLGTLVQKRNEQLRILQDLAEELQRELVSLRVHQSEKVILPPSFVPSTVG